MPDIPAALGYRMPAEWEAHAATWLAWPHKRESWPGKFAPIPSIWAALVRLVARFEPVHVLTGGEHVRAEAQAMIGEVRGVTLHGIRTDDAWIRDHGPTFLTGGANLPPALVDWEYNAWGGKYPPFENDNQVPARIAEALQRRRFTPGIVLEGGAIDVNGSGSVLTTEQCLLNPNRNPGLSRGQVERCLADYLAAPHVIWLGEGIAGDDTDGHIDELARFVGPRTVVAAVEEDPADENYAALEDNLARLTRARDEQGRPLEIVPLPMPRPKYHQGQRLPASYANFYVANGLVVVPQFNDPADWLAIETLQRLFPGREVHAIAALDLVWGLGAFHCITQQEPQAALGAN